jgi:hypothetical protein
MIFQYLKCIQIESHFRNRIQWTNEENIFLMADY